MLSNASRLHKLWMKSVVEPGGFPALRDKVVLNIVDGLQACYDGGYLGLREKEAAFMGYSGKFPA